MSVVTTDLKPRSDFTKPLTFDLAHQPHIFILVMASMMSIIDQIQSAMSSPSTSIGKIF